MNAQALIQKAKTSAFYRRVLNWSLNRMVPFNQPHRFRIIHLEDHHLKVRIPYIRRNFNHIRGLHACALATLSEFATGFLLLSLLDGTKFRLIMQRLEMDYHYQGKMEATAEFKVTPEWLDTNVYKPLSTADAVVVVCEVRIHDVKGNRLTTGHVHWQIKNWEKVKTKA
jgi:acyl-coenzyme A thioesterase PaaI-like protein